MPEDWQTLIHRAVDRAIASFAEGRTTLGAGGLFEMAYPFVAADVPDASHEEIQAAFALVWGIDRSDRAVYERVLAVCDRHDAGDDESIRDVLQRAAASGDLEAAYLLSLSAAV